jgi:hypothetical protein
MLAACLALGGAAHATRTAVDPQSFVLSLPDVPRGYRNGDDSGCGPMIPTGESHLSPAMTALLLQTRPQGCVIELNRAWADTSIGPATIRSASFVFADEDGAKRLFALRMEATQLATEIRDATGTSITLGDEAFLLQGRGLNLPAAAVIWRSGNVVAVLGTEPADVTKTRALAETQQALIAQPATRTAPAVDLELQLDDPTIDVPVYWLGSSFAPGGGLPALRLTRAEHIAVHGGQGPGMTIRLGYATTAHAPAGVTIDVWQPGAWKRFAKTQLGRLVWDSPCAKKSVVKLAKGRAEIFSGYASATPLRRPCPRTPPNLVVAHVYLTGATVAVNMPFCLMCVGVSARPQPYGTVTAMRAIARALTPRPPKR